MEMPVNCTSLPLAGVPIYSPWWVALLLQRATTLSPRLLSLQWCLPHPGSLLGKVMPGALGSLGLIGSEEFLCCVEVSGMVPECSCCSLRTRVLFSCADIFVSSRSAFPDETQHTVHDAIRRESVQPEMTPVSRLRITDTTSSLGSGGLGSKRSGLAPDDEDHERGEDGQYSGSQERRRVVAQGDADHSSQVGGERRSDLVSEENPAEDHPHVRSSEAVRYQRHCRRHGRYVVQPEEDREYGQPRELRNKRQEQQGEPLS